MANELTWWQRTGIGASGGLGLALLKLIDAGFFVPAGVSSVQAITAYLTYLSYIVLGGLAGCFLTDQDLPPRKIRKSSFVSGLLAPSMLLAILGAPVKPQTRVDESRVEFPALSGWFIGAAHAQQPSASPTAAEPTARIVTMSKAELEPSYTDALLSAVGRRAISTPYAYVIGTTRSRVKALEAAKQLNTLLKHAATRQGLNDTLAQLLIQLKLAAMIIQPEGTLNYYVTLAQTSSRSPEGGRESRLYDSLGDEEEINALKTKLNSAAIETLRAQEAVVEPEDRKALALVLNGKVAPARSLFRTP